MPQPRLHIWKGNVKVVDNSQNTMQNQNPPNKFDTCKHRSEEHDIQVRTCCQTFTRRGISCLKRNIDFIHNGVCQACDVYERKETQT